MFLMFHNNDVPVADGGREWWQTSSSTSRSSISGSRSIVRKLLSPSIIRASTLPTRYSIAATAADPEAFEDAHHQSERGDCDKDICPWLFRKRYSGPLTYTSSFI